MPALGPKSLAGWRPEWPRMSYLFLRDKDTNWNFLVNVKTRIRSKPTTLLVWRLSTRGFGGKSSLVIRIQKGKAMEF